MLNWPQKILKSPIILKFINITILSGFIMNAISDVLFQNDDEPVWVDAVGWDDAEVEDEETFKNILKFIDKHNITKVSLKCDEIEHMHLYCIEL